MQEFAQIGQIPAPPYYRLGILVRTVCKSVLFGYTIPRHYLTCATRGTINPRRAYDWRAESDADYLLLTT